MHLMKIQMHHTHPLRVLENELIQSGWRSDYQLEKNHRQMETIGLLNEEIRWKHNEKRIKQEVDSNWTQLQFIHISDTAQPWTILQLFDLDCCQVGFDGNSVISTHAFKQSINTQTLINYK